MFYKIGRALEKTSFWQHIFPIVAIGLGISEVFIGQILDRFNVVFSIKAILVIIFVWILGSLLLSIFIKYLVLIVGRILVKLFPPKVVQLENNPFYE